MSLNHSEMQHQTDSKGTTLPAASLQDPDVLLSIPNPACPYLCYLIESQPVQAGLEIQHATVHK